MRFTMDRPDNAPIARPAPSGTLPMTPLDPDSVRPGEARSLDGTWTYHRGVERGRPWYIYHVPSGRSANLPAPSLDEAREMTASGGLLAALEAEAERIAAIRQQIIDSHRAGAA